MPVAVRKALVDRDSTEISIKKQAELLGLSRSSLYYRRQGKYEQENSVKNTIDEIYTNHPFYGSRRLAVVVGERLSINVNRKRIQRLMREVGIQAIGPSPSLSKAAPGHKIYPHLVRGRRISAPNEVWSTDITYVKLLGGFAYLTAVIDWLSLFVLSWRLSNTLDSMVPIEAMNYQAAG